MADLCYIGTGGFQRVAGDGIQLSEGGEKSGTLIYEGDAAGLSAFLDDWSAGEAHPDDSDLRKVGHRVTNRGARVVVAMQFAGLDGGLPAGGARRGTVRKYRSAVITKGSNKYTVSFYAPNVTVEWESGSEPGEPSKKGTSGVTDGDDITIAEAAPIGEALAIDGDVDAHFTADTDYQTIAVCDGFEITPEGDDFKIREVWTLTLADLV